MLILQCPARQVLKERIVQFPDPLELKALTAQYQALRDQQVPFLGRRALRGMTVPFPARQAPRGLTVPSPDPLERRLLFQAPRELKVQIPLFRVQRGRKVVTVQSQDRQGQLRPSLVLRVLRATIRQYQAQLALRQLFPGLRVRTRLFPARREQIQQCQAQQGKTAPFPGQLERRGTTAPSLVQRVRKERIVPCRGQRVLIRLCQVLREQILLFLARQE